MRLFESRCLRILYGLLFLCICGIVLVQYQYRYSEKGFPLLSCTGTCNSGSAVTERHSQDSSMKDITSRSGSEDQRSNITELKRKPSGRSESRLENVSNIPDFQLVQQAASDESELYVYSAILDNEEVVLIALKRLTASIRGLFCTYSYSNEDGDQQYRKEHTVKASVRNMNEHHDKKYTAAFITCPLLRQNYDVKNKEHHEISKLNGNLPIKVRLVTSRDLASKPSAEFVINTGTRRCSNKSKCSEDQHFPETEKNKVVDFTVCSAVVQGNYSNAAQLVEMLEMNRLLGAGRVVLYNNSIAPSVDAVLRVYTQGYEQGRDSLEVKVHSWQLPDVMSLDNLHYFGQMAAINDCLYRYRSSSHFMVFTDLDEFIIPRQTSNWSELIATAKRRDPSASSFQFRNTIFRSQWRNPMLEFPAEAQKYKSAILGTTLREDCVYPVDVRTKLIVDPFATKEMGIHFTWRMRGKTYNVPMEDGLLQHYRSVLPPNTHPVRGFNVTNCNNPVQDVLAVNVFGSRLAARLGVVWSKITLTGT